MFQFLTHVELSRSMAAILEMPQYVAYQKNVVYAFIKLSAKSHSFNILRTMNGLSCPTKTKESNKHAPRQAVVYIKVHLVLIYTLAFSNVLLVLALNFMVHKSGYCKCSLA